MWFSSVKVSLLLMEFVLFSPVDPQTTIPQSVSNEGERIIFHFTSLSIVIVFSMIPIPSLSLFFRLSISISFQPKMCCLTNFFELSIFHTHVEIKIAWIRWLQCVLFRNVFYVHESECSLGWKWMPPFQLTNCCTAKRVYMFCCLHLYVIL